MNKQLSRRTFLKGLGITSGGLMIGINLSGCSGDSPAALIGGPDDLVPNAFLQITPDNRFIFVCPRDEMGQGISTGLATLFGEELDVDPAEFQIKFPGVHADYGHPAFGGVQSTGGSAAIRGHYLPLRQAGADVRALIVAAAAVDLGTTPGTLRTENGYVLLDEESYPYAQFIETANSMALPEETPLKSPSDFRYIGKDFPRLDAMEKSTGTANYGIDFDIPGMHYALVKRCPVHGGTFASYSDVTQMKGVTDVIEVTNGIAVVAKTFWQASQARDALEVNWNLPDLKDVSTETVRSDYETALNETEGNIADSHGDLENAFGANETTIEQDFWTPYLAHAPLEPVNVVVKIENDEVDVWTGIQGPIFAQGYAARVLDIPKEQVKVHNTYLGGGFGRRLMNHHVAEATEIAAASNKVIKLIWSREDDIQHGVYRPASLMRIKASANAKGTITGWMSKRVGGNILPDRVESALPGVLPTGVPDGVLESLVSTANKVMRDWRVDGSSVEGLAGDYDFPNKEVEHVTINHGLPLNYWRSVGHSYTAFAKEVAIDQLAVKSGIDPIELRLRNTTNNPRLSGVIRSAEEQMSAFTQAAKGSVGFAAHGSFHSYVAQAADVSVQAGKIIVNKVLCIVDCGQVVNPDIVRAQMEGAVMFGLTAALHGNLDLKDGAIVQSNFHDYPILRMNEAPAVEVVIIDSDEAPTGVGEVGLPPVAPAAANAIFRESGQLLTNLPFKLA